MMNSGVDEMRWQRKSWPETLLGIVTYLPTADRRTAVKRFYSLNRFYDWSFVIHQRAKTWTLCDKYVAKQIVKDHQGQLFFFKLPSTYRGQYQRGDRRTGTLRENQPRQGGCLHAARLRAWNRSETQVTHAHRNLKKFRVHKHLIYSSIIIDHIILDSMIAF